MYDIYVLGLDDCANWGLYYRTNREDLFRRNLEKAIALFGEDCIECCYPD